MIMYGNGGRPFDRCDDFDPLRSSIGVGPQGDGIDVRVVEDDPYGYYRLQFLNSNTGEVLTTTPNLDPGSRFFLCTADLQTTTMSTREFTAGSGTFTTMQALTIQDARVGDLVIYDVSRLMSDDADRYHDFLGFGVITSINNDPDAGMLITFNEVMEFDTTMSVEDLSISTSKLENGAVTSEKIANGSVTETKLASNAVSTNKIEDDAVTIDKLALAVRNEIHRIHDLAHEIAAGNGLTSLIPESWMSGGIQTNPNTSNFGQILTNINNSIVIKDKLYADRDVQIYCDDGYDMAFIPYSDTTDESCRYGEEGYTYNDLMWKKVVLVPKGNYFRIVCRLSPNDTSAVLDPSVEYLHVHFITNMHETQNWPNRDIQPSISWKAAKKITDGVVDWTGQTYLYFKDILTAKKPIKAIFDSSVIKPYIFYYDDDGTYLGQGDLTTIPKGANYRIGLSSRDGSSVCHFAHALALSLYEMDDNFMWYGTSNGMSINYSNTRVIMCMPEKYDHAVVLTLSDYTNYKVGACLRADGTAVSKIDWEPLHNGPVGVQANKWFFAYLGKADDTAFTLDELNEAVSMLQIKQLHGVEPATDGVRNELSVLKRRITALEGESVPAYYESETYSLDEQISNILTAMPKPIENVAQFAFSTDFHATEYNQQFKTRALLNKIMNETHCTMFVNGGDVVDGKLMGSGMVSSIDFAKQMQQYSYWLIPDGCNLALMVAGNHDGGASWNPTGDALIDEQTLYDVSAISRNAGNAIVDPNSKCQVYVDDAYHKIRWIVGNYANTINIGKWDNTQSHGVLGESAADSLSFIGQALSGMPVGWTAVVFNHILINSWNNGPVKGAAALESLCDLYNSRGSANLQDRAFDFSESQGTIACIISGHMHIDYDYTTTGGIPCIATTTDNCAAQCKIEGGRLIRDVSLRPAGTPLEQAIDVFTINTTARTISTVRIGYGEDRVWSY